MDERRFVAADIPGLIEGASDGVGLGDRFLRHIERTHVLVHLLDAGAMLLEGRDLLEGYEVIRAELAAYEASLPERTEIVALNKIDLVADRSRPGTPGARAASPRARGLARLGSHGRRRRRAAARRAAGARLRGGGKRRGAAGMNGLEKDQRSGQRARVASS